MLFAVNYQIGQSNTFCALCEMEKLIPLILMGKEIVKPKHLFFNLSKVNDLLNPGCQEVFCYLLCFYSHVFENVSES